MRPVEVDEVRPAIDKVFANTDPQRARFRETIPRKAIFYPVIDAFAGDRPAFGAAVESLAEGGFFVSLLERREGRDVRPNDWYVALDEVEAYAEQALPLDTLLVSKQGRWGILLAHDGYALAGGPGDFMDTLLKGGETPLDVQARGLVSEWEELIRVVPSADRSWLRPLIEHVYGRERARELYAAD